MKRVRAHRLPVERPRAGLPIGADDSDGKEDDEFPSSDGEADAESVEGRQVS